MRKLELVFLSYVRNLTFNYSYEWNNLNKSIDSYFIMWIIILIFSVNQNNRLNEDILSFWEDLCVINTPTTFQLVINLQSIFER